MRVILAGATGWAGSAVARTAAGQTPGAALGEPALAAPAHATARAALERPCDVFGTPGLRLHLAHHAESSAEPYVEGTLPATRQVAALKGVHRGLDAVMSL